jgi:molybdopterin molybdotransferase
VGSFDYVRRILGDLGYHERFWKVAQKPGKPLTFGTLGHRLFFGLPGNPVSALVCFGVYVWPVLRKLAGHAAIHHTVVQARLAAPVRKATGLTEFVRVHLTREGDGWVATAFATQGSGVLSSVTRGAGLLVGPAAAIGLEAGTVYPVIVLDDTTLATANPSFSS